MGNYFDNIIGRKFGNYSVTDILGTGMSSKVFKAYHSSLKYHASIKVFNPQVSSDSEFVKLFQIETKKFAQINHPNIVKIYDAGVQNELVYIITEYISGKSLERLIEEGKNNGEKIQVKQIVNFVKSAGRALSYAHIQNVLHGNVKPSNILVEKTGRVVLTDFGIAKMTMDNKDKITGKLVNTHPYLAPELSARKPESKKADIYSLGVIFHELIVGQVPYSSKKTNESLEKQGEDTKTQSSSMLKNVPERFTTIILKSIDKKPKNRYKNMAAMVADIEKLKEAIPEQLAIATSELVEPPPPEDISPDKSTDLRVILHFLKTGQILELPLGTEFSIGRRNENPPVFPDIDLSPYKGYVWGISRMHAKLIVGEGSVRIVDLNSTNGTWIYGKQLEPNVPFRLRHGAIVSLGDLHTQVLIYKERNIQ
ncbi:MAG: protein kinase [Chloroflexi bacterium]|nr:protein kinase [Chloroflexota bacterium]